MPDNFPTHQIRIHHLLGNILDDGGQQDQAAKHYETAIQIADRLKDEMGASMLCREMARLKLKLGDLDDAKIYADDAVRRAERLGPGGANAVARSRELANDIRRLQQTGLRP